MNARQTADEVVASWPAVLGSLTAGRDLTRPEAVWAMDEIFSDNATPAQIAAFGVALKMKGETPEELRALADTMLATPTWYRWMTTRSTSSEPAATAPTR